jgi:membrane-bound lytic murein transglycosylase D
MDPFKSTDAAARLLRDNHRSVHTWPLAITSYNHGASGMRRAVQRLGTRDIDTIVRKYRSRTFGFASRNFYASFLAALEVDRNAARYFGPLQPDPPVEYALIEMPHFYPAGSLGSALGVDLATLREHNNALRPSVWTGSKHVPRGYALRVPANLVREPVPQLLAKIPESERLTKQHRDRFYKVQRGDTLSAIARRFGVRESQLVAINNLRSRHRIRVGQVLVLPGVAPVNVRREEPPSDGVYRVRRGDTVSIIARRFGTSEAELVALNGLRNRNHIAVGQRLKIPGAQGTTASEPATIASAALEPTPAAPSRADADGRAAASAGAEANGRGDSNGAPETPLQPEPAQAAALEPARAAAAAESPAPEPSDYAIHANDRITVQAAETLGHYADWLEIRASQLRALNGMRYGEDLVIGHSLRLDLSRVAPEEFERRRLEYHRSLQEEFFDAYIVTGTERHILRRGETIWELATREYRVPVWLLRQYNPDLDFGALPAGVAMVVPVIEPRNG